MFSEPISAVSPGLHGRVLAVLARTDTALTGRAIGALVRPTASQRGAQQVLDDLVRNGLAKSEPAGRARLYTLNREHLAAPAIDILVNLRERLLARMAAEADSWTVPATSIWLFGSAARGDAEPESDIDVLVLRPDDVDDSDPDWQEQVDTLSEKVSNWTGNGCEILEFSRAELGELKASNERIIAELKRDAVVVSGTPPRQILGRTQGR